MKLREKIINFQKLAEVEFNKNKNIRSLINYILALIVFFSSTILAAVTLPFRVFWNFFFKSKNKKIITASNQNLDRLINQNNIVLIDFWAEWCGPCLVMNPIIEEFSTNIKKVQVVKINADLNMKTMRELNVRGLPHFLLYKNGKEVKRYAGPMTLLELNKFCFEK